DATLALLYLYCRCSYGVTRTRPRPVFDQTQISRDGVDAMRKFISICLTALFLASVRAMAALPLESLRLPPGFKAAIYADGVDDARSLALGPDGTVYVGTRQAGKVYALVNRQRGERTEEVVVIADNLESPNGVSLRNG